LSQENRSKRVSVKGERPGRPAPGGDRIETKSVSGHGPEVHFVQGEKKSLDAVGFRKLTEQTGKDRAGQIIKIEMIQDNGRTDQRRDVGIHQKMISMGFPPQSFYALKVLELKG
jgi:hypothetical protein